MLALLVPGVLMGASGAEGAAVGTPTLPLMGLGQ